MTTASRVRTVAIVTSIAFSLANFRGPLIARLVASGLRVQALAPDYDDETRRAVRALGAEPIDISLDRTGLRPCRDLIDAFLLIATFRRLKPDLVFCYFIKPVIYGSIAARLAGVRRCYALVAGLGYVFTPDAARESWKRWVLRHAASAMYRIAFRLCRRVFLQNSDDLALLVGQDLLPRSKAVLVSGSGIDLKHFQFAPAVLAPMTFVLVARLLREKGIVEYVKAARRIRMDHPSTMFLLLGEIDRNPGGLPRAQIAAWMEEGTIEWPGQVSDVRPWIARSSVFVLPSYREGKPRSTQEAMAMGRPIITTDVPGCRDTVDEGVNGFKVRDRDAKALEAAMRRFVDRPDLVVHMGLESRRLAEEHYNVHRINAVMLAAMELGYALPSEPCG